LRVSRKILLLPLYSSKDSFVSLSSGIGHQYITGVGGRRRGKGGGEVIEVLVAAILITNIFCASIVCVDYPYLFEAVFCLTL
jgi:hypothetical protein